MSNQTRQSERQSQQDGQVQILAESLSTYVEKSAVDDNLWHESEDRLLEIGRRSLGLHLDTFQQWEASKERHLPEYIVTTNLPNMVWHNHSTWVFSPPGGGKTALRIYTTMNCWQRLGSSHSFPVLLLPTTSIFREITKTESNPYRFLFRSVLKCLLIGIAYYPDRFLRLNIKTRVRLAKWFAQELQGVFFRSLEMLKSGIAPDELARIIEPSYVVEIPSAKPNQLLQLANTLDMDWLESTNESTVSTGDSSKRDFIQLMELLLNQFGFGSIYFLIDGVDNELNTVRNPRMVTQWIEKIAELLSQTSIDNLYLKGFLPEELMPLLADLDIDGMRIINLEWTPNMLLEILRNRISFASMGQFDSLNSVAGPGCENIEEALIDGILLLPREMLVVARQLIIEYARRTGTNGGPIEMSDITAARSLYFQRVPT